MSKQTAVLLLANDVYHHLGHRIFELLPCLENRFALKAISLVPPGLSSGGEQAPNGAFLRGWYRRVLCERAPCVWELPAATAVRRVPLPSFLGPFANRYCMARVVHRHARERFACVIAQGPVAGRVALELDQPFIYDHADNYAAGRVAFLHRMLFRRWQDRCLQKARAISCAGPALFDHAMKYRQHNVSVFPNGVHLRRYALSRAEPPEPVIVYVGGLERDCGLDAALKAVALLSHPPRFEIAGSGPAERSFRGLASSLGLSEHVRWLGPVPHSAIPRLLTTAWVGMALFADTKWNQYAFHLKILEYMAAGLPFVTTEVGDAGRLARETGAGRVVDPTPRRIAETLSDLFSSETTRRMMSQHGRDASSGYDWHAIGERYASWVETILEDLR
jgi:glycosyltransferase involved in cell wall biosynthesis